MSRHSLLLFLLLIGACVSLFADCSVSPAMLPTAVVDRPYSAALSLAGCTQTSAWRQTAGTSLPPGMSFNTATGTLSGTPTATGSGYSLCYSVDHSSGFISGCMNIKVNPPITLEPGPYLNDGFVSVDYGAWIVKGGADESAGARPYTYTVTSGTMPPGITGHPQGGFLTGAPTAVGDYEFTLQVTCARGSTASRDYRIAVGPPGDFYASYSKMKFQAKTGSAPQTIPLAVSTTDISPVSFTPSVLNPSGPGSPSWLTVTPGAATATPAQLAVQANPGGLAAGTYTGQVRLTPVGKDPFTVTVELTVADYVIDLRSWPAEIGASFRMESGESLKKEERILVGNAGDGTAALTAKVVSGKDWLSVTPASFTLGQLGMQSLPVSIDATKLDYGGYHGSIQIDGPGWQTTIPVGVSVDYPARKARITRGDTGHTYSANCGLRDNADTKAEFKLIIANMDFGPTDFRAELLGFGNLAYIEDTTGRLPDYWSKAYIKLVTYPCRIVASSPGQDGVHGATGLLKITAPGASNSPFFDVIWAGADDSRWDIPVASTQKNVPQIKNDGILFISPLGSTATQQAQFVISNPDVVPLTYSVTTASSTGTDFLSTTSPGGVAAPASDTAVFVQANSTSFDFGQYSASSLVQIQSIFGEDLIRGIPVSMLVSSPGGGSSPGRDGAPLAASTCTPSRLLLVPGEPLPHFNYLVDYPADLKARVYDDCGNPVTGATVAATFSNGERARTLTLTDAERGLYSGIWYPLAAVDFLTVTLHADKPGLEPASYDIHGYIKPNAGDPVVVDYAVMSSLNPIPGAFLAPGGVAAIYGQNLALSTEMASAMPLPKLLGKTRVWIGGVEAPLFFVSAGQVNVQIPAELDVSLEHSIFVEVDGRYSRPKSIRLTKVNPGVAAYSDGRVIAQHGDYSLVGAASPARPDEWIALYLVGMGATAPAVPSGEAAPMTALSHVAVQPTVTIGGAPAEIAFAGLTPGAVGLYQINCKVPASAPDGDLAIEISQNGVLANPVTLPVRQQRME